MLKHRTGRCASSIRDGLANGGDDLFHHLPVLHAQIAGKRLFDRQLDLGAISRAQVAKKTPG